LFFSLMLPQNSSSNKTPNLIATFIGGFLFSITICLLRQISLAFSDETYWVS
jgi:hypothetical protein